MYIIEICNTLYKVNLAQYIEQSIKVQNIKNPQKKTMHKIFVRTKKLKKHNFNHTG